MQPGDCTVAIKVLNLAQRGASKSFTAECEALRGIRHRNLVKILTACSSVDFKGNSFKALVLQYMPNGSLDRCLHPETSNYESTPLNLMQRLKIAVDVASALDYLHNHGHVPVVHCDLKPSNVLLDEDMCGHLSDFGLAKILLDNDENKQTASIGVKAPLATFLQSMGLAANHLLGETCIVMESCYWSSSQVKGQQMKHLRTA
ncbi:hypothetical protein HPP92_008491 [Vanilla planifolia]|uniref:non-specific serine/threonine protein kinase n=1 Tax=Vanilla planifolia TaxID=51239 RepID=A0A835R8H5_VANPL|nr:hypothetical protein HPP92_008670 [Vanilla planifolia]KAG0486396.1 hypothetical protein HPP92_008491 [Vanilla planifolia]